MDNGQRLYLLYLRNLNYPNVNVQDTPALLCVDAGAG